MKKTAYDMRISDWSSDVCSSDLQPDIAEDLGEARRARREDDVAGECIAPADADADAVHRGDRRLLEPCDRARDAMQAPDLGHRPGDTGVAHLLYVHACAKGVSGAGQDDGAHVVGFRGIFERRPELERKSVV